MLDVGDANDPAGEDEAVEGEEDGEDEAESGQEAAVSRHGAVRSGFVYLRHKIRLGEGRDRGKVPGPLLPFSPVGRGFPPVGRRF
ncbi:hypothetical protein GCM10010335_24360 [Streptomyces galbus]|nr:hypothetical protein GCM10010335_24360 [Streptomyces galbus]